MKSALPFSKWNHISEVKVKLRWRRIFCLPRPCIKEELTASIELGVMPYSHKKSREILGARTKPAAMKQSTEGHRSQK